MVHMTSLPQAPYVAVSIDLDSAATHLAGYRRRPTAPDRILERAVPRLLDLLADRGMRATFFVVARDVEPKPAWLAAITDGGHELASHSGTHPVGISRLGPERMRAEVADARGRLEEATGIAMDGFRAPSWDVTSRLLDAVAQAGHRYDASLLPTPLLVPARVMVALKSRRPSTLLEMPFWPMSLRRLPHVMRTRHGPIIEIPVSVAPPLRWPVYHTLRHGWSDARFEEMLDGFTRRGEPLSYPLHAIDAIGADEELIEPSLRRHPGAAAGRAEKLALLGRTLDSIAHRFRSTTLGDLAIDTQDDAPR